MTHTSRPAPTHIVRDAFVQVGRRYLLWVVSTIISLEALYNAVQGVLDRRPDHALLWLFAAGSLFGLGAFAEIVKTVRGE